MKHGPLVDPEFVRKIPMEVLTEVLTEKERWAIQWRFHHGMEIDQLGRALGCGSSCAQKQIAMALYKLGQYYNPHGGRSGPGSVTAPSEAYSKRRVV